MAITNKYYSDFFIYKDGHLFCEEIMVEDIRTALKQQCFPSSPFFLYSKAQIIENVNEYKKALTARNFPSVLNFAMKANSNLSILKELREQGCSLTLVSGMELKAALDLQFEPSKLVLNGNGKMEWEIESAVQNNVLLNVDSLFNLRQTISVCRNLGTASRVLLRINPDIQTDVHEYMQTSTSSTKFGVDSKEMDAVLDELKGCQEIQLVGLHCHLGSTIDSTHLYRQSVQSLMTTFRDLQNKGFTSMKYLNIGGGLGIPYTKHANRTKAYRSTDKICVEDVQGLLNNIKDEEERYMLGGSLDEFKSERISYHHLIRKFKSKLETGLIGGYAGSKVKSEPPSPHDLVTSISDLVEDDVTVILEPGRSLVGNAGVLVCSVLGCSQSTTKRPRNGLCSAFYLRSLSKPSATQWYADVRVGINKLSNVVKSLCGKAGIEGYYTNHSLRATAATRMYEVNLPEQLICEKTGHRSDAVRSYKRTSTAQEKFASDVVQGIKRKIGNEENQSVESENQQIIKIRKGDISIDIPV